MLGKGKGLEEEMKSAPEGVVTSYRLVRKEKVSPLKTPLGLGGGTLPARGRISKGTAGDQVRRIRPSAFFER